jgi:RNA-binding protein YlmH
MDKASLINRYAKTPEQRVMFAHILDLALRSENRNTVESGNFLPESDADTVSDMLRSAGIHNYVLFGGCDGAERKCPVFLPDYLTEDDITDSPALAGIAFATAEVNRFDLDRADFTHRDCLGALMGLGIERETVGDIVCSGGKAVIVLKTGVAELVKNELDSIGRFRVTVSVGDTAVMERHDDSVELSDTVASMRLDAVCASVFRLSRGAAAEAVGRGLVAVNGSEESKPDAQVTEGDKISLRGKGRVLIGKTAGTSKKGRIRFEYKKYR